MFMPYVRKKPKMIFPWGTLVPMRFVYEICNNRWMFMRFKNRREIHISPAELSNIARNFVLPWDCELWISVPWSVDKLCRAWQYDYVLKSIKKLTFNDPILVRDIPNVRPGLKYQVRHPNKTKFGKIYLRWQAKRFDMKSFSKIYHSCPPMHKSNTHNRSDVES